MSEQQTFVGTIWKTGLSPKEAAMFLAACDKNNAEYLERALQYSSSEEEAYIELFAHTSAYIVVDGVVWAIDGAYKESDFFEAYKDFSGKIHITASFYDGGTCLEELLTDYIREETSRLAELAGK